MAANVILPYTHTATQPQDASQFMANLNALVLWINTNAALLDGSKAMTGQLSGPNSDPATTAQYARKSYVDGLVSTEAAARAAADLAVPRHGCLLKRAASQSMPGLVETTIVFDTETYDTDAYFPGAGNSTITMPARTAGRYAVFVTFRLNTINTSVVNIKVNGSTSFVVGSVSNIDGVNCDGSGVLFATLNPGDTITFTCQNGNASAKNFTCTVILHRMGAS